MAAAAAAKNTIGSRLVIARNMVIRLGNGSVALISTLAEVWWWRTNTGVVSRAGTGCARHNDNGHMLFDNLYRWPRFERRAQLALARISIGRANVQNHHQQRRFARSMCVCVRNKFRNLKSCRRWKVSLKYDVSGSFASKCFVECCRKHTAEQTEMNLNWFKHEVWVLQLIRMKNEMK